MSIPAPLMLSDVPANLVDYVETISPFIATLFGARAGDFYRAAGLGLLRHMLCHPEVRAFASGSPDAPSALLMARVGVERTTLFFFHVLPEAGDPAHGPALLNYAVEELSAGGRPIYTDYVPRPGLDVDETYLALGFQCRARQLMQRALGGPLPDSTCRPVRPEDLGPLGVLLVDVYSNDPDRHLFPEARTPAEALAWLEMVRAGGLGRHENEWIQVAQVEGRLAGFAAGAEVMPGTGFLLHLAVAAPYRGRGLGEQLLAGICRAFNQAGLDYAGLGVTCDNPAVRLYRRAGFQRVADVPVYFRGDTPPR